MHGIMSPRRAGTRNNYNFYTIPQYHTVDRGRLYSRGGVHSLHCYLQASPAQRHDAFLAACRSCGPILSSRVKRAHTLTHSRWPRRGMVVTPRLEVETLLIRSMIDFVQDSDPPNVRLMGKREKLSLKNNTRTD